jgi:Glycosyltransferase family 10 (fucosyltransferase).
MATPRLRVKLISSLPVSTWLHQFPGNEPIFGDCEFMFDRDAATYDWLVVYDDLAIRATERKGHSSERLACPRAHTLLVTTEPSSIKIYGDDYTNQFGCVLTSQPEWALPHRDRIFSQPGLHWFYGVGRSATLPFDTIAAQTPAGKTDAVSMVYSAKAMRHTLHHHRQRFMHTLVARVPEIETYGRDSARKLDDKADCLRSYRYHVALENHVGLHHWTEKIADPFLGLALPFYYGCPNLEDYFPPESFIRLDSLETAAAADIIRRAVANDEFSKRLSAIAEAKRRVLYEFNLFAVLSRAIAQRHDPASKVDASAMLLSRRALRKSSLLVGARDLYGKLRGRVRHLPAALTGKS